MTQKEKVLHHMQENKKITSMEAFELYKITRLSSIINILRKEGYDIDSVPLIKKTRFGRNTTIAKYIYTAPPREFIQEMLWQ